MGMAGLLVLERGGDEYKVSPTHLLRQTQQPSTLCPPLPLLLSLSLPLGLSLGLSLTPRLLWGLQVGPCSGQPQRMLLCSLLPPREAPLQRLDEGGEGQRLHSSLGLSLKVGDEEGGGR